MMEAAPVASLVVGEPELGFELLIVALDHPATHSVVDQLLKEVFSAASRTNNGGARLLPCRPFDQQPFLGSLDVSSRRARAPVRSAKTKFAFRAFTPAHRAPALVGNARAS